MLWKSIIYGSITAYLGTWIGSLLAFLIGRYIFRDLARCLSDRYKIMRALDLVLRDEGFKFCFLLKICPIVPFNAFNYIAGGTSLSFKNYFLAGCGTIPIVILNIFIGSSIGSVSELVRGEYDNGTASLVILILGLVISLILVVYITCYIRKYLKKIAEK